jgi:pimeloyl-ACP methyl ester carboxylesterase
VAQVLAARHPHRVSSAVIAASAPAFDPAFWRARARAVRRDGLAAVLELTSRRRFSETFLSAHPDVAASLRELATMDPAGNAACCDALASFTHPMAQQIAAPTLIIAGSDDVVTPPRLAREIALLVSSARLQVLPRAGHMVSLEQPQRFNDLIGSHLRSTGSRTNRG